MVERGRFAEEVVAWIFQVRDFVVGNLECLDALRVMVEGRELAAGEPLIDGGTIGSSQNPLGDEGVCVIYEGEG